MRIAYWIPKATDTHTQYVTLSLFFHFNNGCRNVPQYYVICSLHVLVALSFGANISIFRFYMTAGCCLHNFVTKAYT